MAKPTIYLRDGIYIPIKTLPMDVDDIREEYTQRMYDEKICRACPYKADRHSHYCDECEYDGFKGAICFVKESVVDGKKYMRFPIGDRLNIEERMRIDYADYKFKDMRTNVPFDYKIKFTGALRDYQLPMLDGFVKMKHGLIKAPPRTGKTVTSIAIAIALGQRTVIIADQVDFLENFMEEVAAHTNLPQLEEKKGKKLYGFLKSKEDYETFQIGFATYQSFISEKNGQKRLKWLQKNFGLVWTDEVHRANATEYSKFLSKCRMKFKGGCTATNMRKDGKQFIVEHLLGPVVAEATAETLIPKLVVHETPNVVTRSQFRGKAGWTYANKFLSNHKKRNEQILDAIMHDLSNNRSIVIATYFKEHVLYFVNEINRRFGSKIAHAFVGGGGKKNKTERKTIVDKARTGEIRVVVGIRRLMQLGLNVPRWDTLYYAMPMSNEPNWQQESRRICTPGDDKNPPLIRMFVDPELPISLGCFRATWKHSLAMGHKPSKKSLVTASMLGADVRTREMNEDGIYDSEYNESKDFKKKKKKQVKAPPPIYSMFSRKL